MEEEINQKINTICDNIVSLQENLKLAFAEGDKSVFYKVLPRCSKAGQVMNMMVQSFNAISEAQKRMDALKDELFP